jgi:hypothetical protein
MIFSRVFVIFCPYLHICSIPSISLCLLYSFQFFLIVKILEGIAATMDRMENR